MAGAEFIGIELGLDADAAVRTLENLTGMINKLTTKRAKIQLDDGRVVTVAERVDELNNKIAALKSAKKVRILSDGEVNELKKAESELMLINRAIRNANTSAKTFGQTFKSISASISHFGGAMQSMGNALTRFSSPIRGLFRGTVLAAGFKLLNTATSGLEGSFERYDIMNNYAKSMRALGLDADQTFKVFSNQKEAMTAIENLNESVLGLPTGLDEIVAMQKVYAGATGEMVKSTKTAIAANNTFIASGMGSREQRFMQKYLVSLASGAELATTQWESMFRIAPLAMRAVSEELGYASDDFDKFRAEVQSGTLAGEEFLQAFIKVGTEGKVQAAANVVKTTWSGLAANVSNAFKRMGEGILKSLDMVAETYGGRNLVQTLLGFDAEGNKVARGVKDIIDDVSASVQNWIRSNPDRIIDFIDSLRRIDWKGLAKGMAEGLGEILNFMQRASDMFNGKDLSGVGKSLVRASWLGKGLVILGGVVKGLRHPMAFISTGLAWLVKKGLGRFGLFGALKGLFGKKSDAKYAVSGAQMLKNVFGALEGVLIAAGTVVIGGTAGFILFKAVKSMVSDMKDIVDIVKGMSTSDIELATKILGKMADALVTFGVLGAIMGSFGTEVGLAFLAGSAVIGGITAIFSGFFALDTWFIKKAFQNCKEAIDYLIEASKSLEKLEGITVHTDKLNTVMEDFGTIYETLNRGFETGGIFGHIYEAINTDLISTLIENISDIIDAINKASEALDNVPESTAISSKAARVRKVAEEMGKIFEEIDKNFGKESTIVTRFKSWNEESIVKHVSDMIEGINGAIELIDTVPEITDADTKVSRLKDAVINMDDVYDQLVREFGATIFERWETSNAGKIVDNVSTMITSIKTAADNLQTMETISAGLDTAKTNAVEVGTKMSEIFDSLNTAFGRTETYSFEGGEDSGVGKGTATINAGVTWQQKAKANNLRDLLQSYQEGITALRDAYQTIMGSEGDMDFNASDFADKMSALTDEKDGIIAKLKGMFESLKKGFGDSKVDIKTPMQDLALAVSDIKQMITTMQEIEGIEFTGKEGVGGVIDSIKQMISNLKTAFDPTTVQGVIEQIGGFITAVDNLLAQIIEMDGMSAENALEIAITLAPNITGDTETVEILNKAHDDIEAARDAIKDLSEEINLKFPISVTIPGLESAIDDINKAASRLRAAKSNLNSARGGGAIGASTGGYIGGNGRALYRSRGGDIFRPRGTDTVPAMLTPGEYVQRKRAVDFWGIDFMRRVNAMDLSGVMNSLRARAIQNVSRSSVVNNYYYNNQKVVQHVNTNSPDFAFKSASRFAGAF